MKEPGYCFPSPGKTAFNAVYATPLDFYMYSDQSDHRFALNFAISMEELARNQTPFLERSSPLDRIEPTSHFVDVAGGLGTSATF